MPQIIGFADEDTARRVFNGVAASERALRNGQRLTTTGRAFVRVTGAGTSSPAPPAAFGCLEGELVAATDDAGEPDGYVAVSAEPLFVIYLVAEGTPSTGDILEADFVWTDDDGAAVWLGRRGGGSGGGGCDDETLCDGAWHTADYVTAVTLDCTAGTLTLDVTTDGSRDYWTRTTPP